MFNKYKMNLQVKAPNNFADSCTLNEAVELAITECIREGILAEFLQHNRAEVYKVSIFEYDKEEEEQKLQATYEKIGEKRGEKQGELKKAKSGQEIVQVFASIRIIQH